MIVNKNMQDWEIQDLLQCNFIEYFIVLFRDLIRVIKEKNPIYEIVLGFIMIFAFFPVYLLCKMYMYFTNRSK